MAENYGPAGRRLARLRRVGVFSPSQRDLLPLHRHVLDRSRGVLVHSRFAASRLEVAAGVPVRVVPHHLSPAVAAHDGLDRAAARARLGLPGGGDEPLLLSLGFVTRAKGLDVALGALARLKQRGRGVPPGRGRRRRRLRRRGARGAARPGSGTASTSSAGCRTRTSSPSSAPPTCCCCSGFPAVRREFRRAGAGARAWACRRWPTMSARPRSTRTASSRRCPSATDPAEAVAAAVERLLADRGAPGARGEEARDALRRDRTPEASAARILAAVEEWTCT